MRSPAMDVKSVIIGLLAGVCVMLLLGADGKPQAAEQQPVQRYQISTVEPGSIYVLDHKTNHVYLMQTWQDVEWHTEDGFKIPEDLSGELKKTELKRQQPDEGGL